MTEPPHSTADGAPGPAPRSFRLGDWLVVPSQDRIEREGESIRLQHLSMRVLCYLAARPGEMVCYDELLDALWPGRLTSEDAVHRRIADLRQQLGDDARNPRYIETIVKQGYRIVAPVAAAASASPQPRRQRALVAGIGAACLLSLAVGFVGYEQAAARRALEAAIGHSRAALADENYEQAYRLIAPYLADNPAHAELEALRRALLTDVSLETDPPGATVLATPYGDDSGWETLGTTPLEHALPRGAWHLRIEAAGRETVELALPNPGRAFNNSGRGPSEPFVIELPAAGSVPEGMVYVPPQRSVVPLLGYRRIEELGAFFIGRSEVSNAEYQEFVTQGGYENPDYWASLAEAPGSVSFAEVADRFIDTTGRPGPAGWRNGRFPPGTDHLPVSGVSYFEAMAYAAFRGAKLPTARHWARAALGIDEMNWPLARALVPAANLGGRSPLAVEQGPLSTWGSRHMIGNVREWTRDFAGTLRLSLGSSYQGPAWNYTMPVSLDPFERSAVQGFRLASYGDDVTPRAVVNSGKPPRLPDVSEEEYAAILEQLAYPVGSVSAADAELISETPEAEWMRRRIELPTEDAGDPMPVLIFMPGGARQPLEPVVFLPPADSYQAGYPSRRIDIRRYDVDFLVREGRALVWPIIWGTHERHVPPPPDGSPMQLRAWQLAVDRRRNEIGRVIDYLQDSPEFDGDEVGLMAASFGGTFVAAPLLAAEPRLKYAVLMATDLAPLVPEQTPNHVNPNTYWPHVSQPVLLMRGEFDIVATSSPHERQLARVLAAREPVPKEVSYPVAHWPLPARLVRRDVLAWLDRQPAPMTAQTGTSTGNPKSR